MANPLVTVGLPTYNRPEGLLKSLDCFFNQSFENFEIIVADNHSDSDPRDYIPKIYLNDARMNFYRHDQNFGMAFNSEFVWRRASGKYFILASDDDWWDKNFLEDLLPLIDESQDIVAAMSNFYETNDIGNKVTYRSKASYIKNLFGFGIPPYPNHLNLLKEFSSPDLAERLTAFILQKEYDGKANVHRALCRTDVYLNSIDTLYSLNLEGCWAFDQLIAYCILLQGRLAVTDRVLFKCTIGNQKNYVDPRSRLKYLLGFQRISQKYLDSNLLKIVKEAINLRFYDSKVGFLGEFDSLIQQFLRHMTKRSSSENDAQVKKLFELLKNQENIDAYNLMIKYLPEEKSESLSKFTFFNYIGLRMRVYKFLKAGL